MGRNFSRKRKIGVEAPSVLQPLNRQEEEEVVDEEEEAMDEEEEETMAQDEVIVADEPHPALQQQPPVPQAEAPSVLQPLNRLEEEEVADEEEEEMAQDEVIVADEPHPVLHQPILGQDELWYWKDGMEQSHGPFTTGDMIQIRIRETFTGSRK